MENPLVGKKFSSPNSQATCTKDLRGGVPFRDSDRFWRLHSQNGFYLDPGSTLNMIRKGTPEGTGRQVDSLWTSGLCGHPQPLVGSVVFRGTPQKTSFCFLLASLETNPEKGTNSKKKTSHPFQTLVRLQRHWKSHQGRDLGASFRTSWRSDERELGRWGEVGGEGVGGGGGGRGVEGRRGGEVGRGGCPERRVSRRCNSYWTFNKSRLAKGNPVISNQTMLNLTNGLQ